MAGPETCRICLSHSDDDESLFYPCRCTAPVHRRCLDSWAFAEYNRCFCLEHVYSSLIHPKWGICNMFIFWPTPLSLQIQGFLENIWNESCQLNTLRSLPISLSYRSRCWRVHSSLGLLLRGWEKYENELCPVLGSVVVDSSQWPSDDLKHSYIYIYVWYLPQNKKHRRSYSTVNSTEFDAFEGL